MLPTEIGALMRYADECVDFRVIPPAATLLLSRLVFRYRARGALYACVGLDELAGDGMAKGTVIRILRALERACFIFTEKWGVVVNGRWRQMPNRYWLRTADEAKAALVEAREAEEAEVEIAVVTPSESNSCTVPLVLSDSLTSSFQCVSEEAGHEKEVERAPSPEGDSRACGDGDATTGTPDHRQGRPSPDSVGGRVPGQHGGHAAAHGRLPDPVRQADRCAPEDRGQDADAAVRELGRGYGGRLGGIDLLAARRAVIEGRPR